MVQTDILWFSTQIAHILSKLWLSRRSFIPVNSNNKTYLILQLKAIQIV